MQGLVVIARNSSRKSSIFKVGIFVAQKHAKPLDPLVKYFCILMIIEVLVAFSCLYMHALYKLLSIKLVKIVLERLSRFMHVFHVKDKSGGNQITKTSL